MRLLVDHLRVDAVHDGEVVHEPALLLGHVWQHLALLLGDEEVREALLDERAELRVRTRERHELVRVRDLLQRAAALAVGGVDAERLREAGVVLCDRAFVGALQLLATLSYAVGEGAAAWDGLANAAARTGNSDDGAAGL